MKKRTGEILSVIPDNLKSILGKAFEQLPEIEEIRLRTGRPLIVGTAGGNFAVLSSGNISPAIGGAYIVNEVDIKRIFSFICDNSVYAHTEEIKKGYITIRGGHRVGFSGKAVLNNNEIENIRDINSINIRIASQRLGMASEYIGNILKNGQIVNTLVISPPCCGKTTLLRDLTRQISDSGIKVSVIDERGEIAAMYRGIPQNDVGVQTDVIEDAPKAKAIEIMLRSMSPQVIICDEIAAEEDVSALKKCFGAGVGVIASAHAGSYDEIKNRAIINSLLGKNGFKQIIVLRRNNDSISKRITGEIYEV